MPNCPRCKQPVNAHAVSCPNCHNALKAFGHPGMPLYQSEGNDFLCGRCTYDRDDSCNYPKRPHAQSCTLFHDAAAPLVPETSIPASQQGSAKVKNWLYRYRGLIAIALLILLSVFLAFNSL